MRPHRGANLITLLAAGLLLGASTGCTPWALVSNLASLGVGWALRDVTATTTTERQCYHNGVPVDCAELPSDLGE